MKALATLAGLLVLLTQAVPLTPPTARAEESTSIWLEKPASTNFNTNVGWSVLSQRNAPANLPVPGANGKQNAPAEQAFAEYTFTVPAPGGRYQMWGRTFDPVWSSPARWRIDSGAWQNWTPGPAVDREVENKVYPVEWRLWAEPELPAGAHTLRVELTGKRKQGDYPYFVLDVVLLTRGAFRPEGALTPAAKTQRQLQLLAEEAKGLPEEASFQAEARTIAQEALEKDLGAVERFTALRQRIAKAKEVQQLIRNNRLPQISGTVVSSEPDANGARKLTLRWNTPVQGELWIGLLRHQALYATCTVSLQQRERQHEILLPAQTALPEGPLLLQAVLIDQPHLGQTVTEIESAPSERQQKPVASAWGIFRENGGRPHPWSVNANNLMIWDGQPFFPVGGMINSLLSWISKPGEDGNLPSWEDSLRKQLQVLRERGIRDVYFNGFFPHANPEALAHMIAIAEESGMRYGLHPSSTPRTIDAGFLCANKPVEVAPGVSKTVLTVIANPKQMLPDSRIYWCATGADGEPKEWGSATPEQMTKQQADEWKRAQPESAKDKRRIGEELWRAAITLQQPAAQTGLRLHYALKRTLDRSDLNGYLGGMEDQLATYRQAYGNLRFGPGMRMWVDPLQNEMHHNPNSVGAEPAWRSRLADWLRKRYGTVERLCEFWGCREDKPLPDFATAASLVPLSEEGTSGCWLDPERNILYVFRLPRSQALRDVREFSGQLGEEIISRCADELKRIANVPVILKLNCWSSDWFINPRPAGGQDGSGYEPYCYGDSLPYHNSLSAYAQVLQSGRNQWALVTESSAAAFEGQKDYCGYLDRLQMIYDIDQLLMYGAKGFYHFGFAFAGNPLYDTTDLLRDVRQIEWLATQSKAYRAAAQRLGDYRPQVYGWYPMHLRENQMLRLPSRPYEMDGHYTGVPTQIRQAPDGRWIVPALRPDADWFGLLAAQPLMNQSQVSALLTAAQARTTPVYLLQSPQPAAGQTAWPEGWKKAPLNALTAQGIGVIPTTPRALTLEQFQQTVLGYRTFQTESVNGRTTEDGRLLVWTCAERQRADLIVPAGADARDINGKPIKGTPAEHQTMILQLQRPPYEKQTKDFPSYVQGGKYFYPDRGQPEVASLGGVSADELIRLNTPVWQRWLPEGIRPAQVRHWQEAESFTTTTFTQSRLEGFSRYSGGCGIGISTHAQPQNGTAFVTNYRVRTPAITAPVFHLRRMVQMASFFRLELRVDGKPAGEWQGPANALHLNPWSAGLSRNNLTVGWYNSRLSDLSAGEHEFELTVINTKQAGDRNGIDTTLMGAQAQQDGAGGEESDKLGFLQLDAWMLTDSGDTPRN